MDEHLDELAQFLTCCERRVELNDHVIWLFDRVVIAYASQAVSHDVRILPNASFNTDGYWLHGASAKYLLENG